MSTLRWLFAFALGATFISFSAEAARSVVAPPYMRRIIFSFNPASGTGYADGTAIGAIMSVQVMISNLSNIAQTGTISATGTSSAAGEVARSEPINAHIALCANNAGSGNNAVVNFSVPPETTVTVSANVYFTSTYNAAGPSGHTVFDASFTPSLKFTVDQDRGALTATMVPLWDGPVAPYTMCDGTPYNASGAFDVSESRTGVPLLINGGRPF
jgi:hypothetical protein